MLQGCTSSNCSCAAVKACENVAPESDCGHATVSTASTARAAVAEVARILQNTSSPSSSLELLGKYWAARAKGQKVSGIEVSGKKWTALRFQCARARAALLAAPHDESPTWTATTAQLLAAEAAKGRFCSSTSPFSASTRLPPFTSRPPSHHPHRSVSLSSHATRCSVPARSPPLPAATRSFLM